MKRLLIILLLACSNVWADGTAGLTYYTYQGTSGASPSISPLAFPTVRSTGTSANINYSAGSFGATILGSGYADRVIVKWVGYINLPTSGTYYFGAAADDGFKILIDGALVTDSWIDAGGNFRSGAGVALTAGAHALTFWYYENGGGQMVVFQYSTNNTNWAVVPTTMLATDSTYWTPAAPVLCCGGSSSNFNANPVNVTKVQSFVTRTSADSQVYIEQIGNDNEITINQTGTKDNKVDYYNTGSFNTVNITQSGNNSTVANYVDLTVGGNSNTITLTQQSTGGAKGIYATVNDNNNNITVLQKDGGNDYLNLSLSGGNKTVDITQQGSANHMADITLSGAGARSLNLNQQGSTQQFYSINSTCASSCQAITVIQGQ